MGAVDQLSAHELPRSHVPMGALCWLVFRWLARPLTTFAGSLKLSLFVYPNLAPRRLAQAQSAPSHVSLEIRGSARCSLSAMLVLKASRA